MRSGLGAVAEVLVRPCGVGGAAVHEQACTYSPAPGVRPGKAAGGGTLKHAHTVRRHRSGSLASRARHSAGGGYPLPAEGGQGEPVHVVEEARVREDPACNGRPIGARLAQPPGGERCPR